MYWIEWMIWHIQTSPLESADWRKKEKKYLAAKRAGKFKHEDNLPGVRDRVSEAPLAEGSIYDFNDIYIDVAAGESQERRGIVTCMFLVVCYFLFKLTYFAALTNSVWLTGLHPTLKTPVTASNFVLGGVVALLTAAVFYVVLRYGRIIFRLETFVQRRMLIRFNRVTRQVYLHRPKFAGGITVLDWEQVTVDTAVGDKHEGVNADRKLMLFWDSSPPDRPHLHIVFVGKRADGTSDIVNLWEFIRRYMEDGPQSVPAPKKLLGKVPWPWLSVMASLSFFRPLWRAGLRWQVACIVALASPALALHAVGHWVSLLLCWEPRWPRIIREAGLPGKPVPPLSTAADWPPLPVAQPTRKQSRRTRKPPKRHTGQAQQAKDRSAPDSAPSAEKRHEDSTSSGDSLNDSNKSTRQQECESLCTNLSAPWEICSPLAAIILRALGVGSLVTVGISVLIAYFTAKKMEKWFGIAVCKICRPMAFSKPFSEQNAELKKLYEALNEDS